MVASEAPLVEIPSRPQSRRCATGEGTASLARGVGVIFLGDMFDFMLSSLLDAS